MSLTDKVIVVTGGTGPLGSAVVRAMLDDGARVAIAAYRSESLARLLAELAAGDRADGQAVDLTDEAQVHRFAAWTAERFGGIDGLAATVGGYAGGTPVHETELAIWRQMQERSLTTTFLTCKAVVPYLIARGGGAIVTVGSRPALHGTANLAAYSVAKSGVLRLTEALADELKAHNISANAILPSTIDTPSNRAAMPKADTDAWVEPEQIAAVIRWLLGPEARIISGAAIPVYGHA